jgi:hypothetical protein
MRTLPTLLFAALLAAPATAGTLPLTPLQLPGGGGFPLDGIFQNPDAPPNLSGAVLFEVAERPMAAVVTDEGFEFALVDLSGEGRAWAVDLGALVQDVKPKATEGAGRLGDPADPFGKKTKLGEAEEIDLEGISVEGDRLFLCGSATLKRKKPNRSDPVKNRKRLETVEPVSGGEKGDWKRHSNMLYELKLGWEGGEPRVEVVAVRDLRDRFSKIRHLRRALAIPSKENGLDIEGYARQAGKHVVGLRGPVLRGHAVVAIFSDDLEEVELRYLWLGGYGIRSIEYVPDAPWGAGFYISAGLTMEGVGDFRLYRWDGQSDAFMGPGPGLEEIGSFPPPDPAWKAEGLFGCGGQLCVSFDGTPGGAPHVVGP